MPIEAFDFIVVDECHRSIYNLWRQVLEYFDAFLIGLTATPTPQTIGFFDGNVVQDYSHEKAVADGVNVGYDVYRIRTRITQGGATLEGKPEFFVPMRDLEQVIDEVTRDDLGPRAEAAPVPRRPQGPEEHRMDAELVRSLVRASRLRNSILKCAFEGKLVPSV